MPETFFPHRPLRFSRPYLLRQRLWSVLLWLSLLPGLALFIGLLAATAKSGGPSLKWRDLVPALLLLGGGLFPPLLHWRYRRGRAAVLKEGIEVQAPITSVQEHVVSGSPSGRLTYAYQLPASPGVPGDLGARQVSVSVNQAMPLHPDAQGNRLVVLVLPRPPYPDIVPRADFYPLAFEPAERARMRERLLTLGARFSFGRGFPHLELVDQAIKLIFRNLAEGRLPRRPQALWSYDDSFQRGDAVVSVQRLARSIIQVYGFDSGAVVVTFLPQLSSAGRVEYEPGQGFFIEIHTQYADRLADLITVLSHEIAHIFLVRHGLAFENRFGNEVLTDVTAALWGFGRFMVESYKNEVIKKPGMGEAWVRNLSSLGYITPDECAYAMAKAWELKSLEKPTGAPARGAYRRGGRLARRIARTPPLEAAPFWRRWSYLLDRRWSRARRLYRFEEGRVIFRCPHCSQQMRLPIQKRGRAGCPNCRAKLPFSS